MICRDLKEAIASKFPEAVDIAIAGYLFLRLINPALVVPDGIGLVDCAFEALPKPTLLYRY
jgi:hypothetical protein